MASIEFTAFPRQGEGRGASRRLRHAGKAPGIVYGAGVEPTPIELDHNALIHALKNEAFHASILSMKLDGKAQKVLLRDVQMHPFRAQVLHVDFQRIDENKKIHMKVPLHYVNETLSPAVKLGGAIVSHIANDLDVSCLPKDLPEFIEVDLSAIEPGKSVHVSEIKLPPGRRRAHARQGSGDRVRDGAEGPRRDRGSAGGRGRRRGAGGRSPRRREEGREEGREEEIGERRRREGPARKSPRALFAGRALHEHADPWGHRSASSSAWATPAASTTRRATTPASGSSTRWPQRRAPRSRASHGSTARSRRPAPTCGSSSPRPT